MPSAKTGLEYDEGPDKDKGFGPYVQSERVPEAFLKPSKSLVAVGIAMFVPAPATHPPGHAIPSIL